MKNKLSLLASVIVASTAFTTTSALAAENTLDKVLEKGVLSCGVSTGLPGFLKPELKG